MKQPIKMTPGDDLHLTALMAPFSLNLVTGQDRQHLLGYGRAAFEAGKAGQCLLQIQEPAEAEQAAWHAGLDESRAQAAPPKSDYLEGVNIPNLREALIFLGRENGVGQGEVGDKLAKYVNSVVSGVLSKKATLREAPLAAPAAVAVPDERAAFERVVKETMHDAPEDHIAARLACWPDGAYKDRSTGYAWWAWQHRAALAATPAAAAPVVLPEPVAWRHSRTYDLHDTEDEVQLADGDEHAQPLFTEQQVRALQVTATGLPAQAVAAPHPDDVAVDALITLMKAKLAKQRAKGYGGWDTDCTRARLSELLRGHVDKGDPVDVANFCAFLLSRGETIAPPAAPPASQRDELLQVALDFIGTLTGMSPPPIEVAPPEVFSPFYAFVDRVQAITAPHARADVQDALTFEQRMSDWQHGDALDAERYRWLRSRDLETISQGGVFAGMTPQNVILNEEDLDQAVDAAIAAAKGE